MKTTYNVDQLVRSQKQWIFGENQTHKIILICGEIRVQDSTNM